MADLGGAHLERREVDITIVVSCYNEEDLIVGTLENVTSALTEIGRSYEIIVVDDASRDRSVQVVQDYINANPNLPIQLKANAINRGLGFNYVETAFAGKGKYFRLCVGDDAEPKEVLVNLFQYIGRADIVIPYNYRPVVDNARIRNLLSATYTRLVNLISGYNIRYYNGLAIHLRYNVTRWPPSSAGFGFQADIITRLLDEGATYMQVPSYSVNRKGGASTALRFSNILSVGHTFLEIGIRRLKNWLYGRKTAPPVEIHLKAASAFNGE
jgi:glycosyltransferase involved in cell wall biosynthesis